MQEATLAKIKEIAIRLHEEGSPWHFHILTPGCTLNETAQYVFVLEDLGARQTYAHYSKKPEKELGQTLAPLLHGKKVMGEAPAHSAPQSSKTVQEMVNRAQRLNVQGTPWHHHVLFPNCRFNERHGQWTLLFEDTQNHETLQDPSAEEPLEALKYLEPLFYAR
jgi:hypothetical protein